MAQYYYLMAQLPANTPTVRPNISYASFKDLALRFLSKKDAAILESLRLSSPRSEHRTGSALIDAFHAYDRVLRLFIAKGRAAALARDFEFSVEEQDLLAYEFDARRHAQSAIAIQDPLEAETFLNRCRFQVVDELSRREVFNSQAVFAYAILLLLHERIELFSRESGRAEYNMVYDEILKGKE